MQQCTLHEAHVDAIHEWAERAKTAEKKLAAVKEPVQEPWEHLKQYGYAPGSYMSRCHACDKIASGVDKRAITCRPCAEVRHAESQKAEPVGIVSSLVKGGVVWQRWPADMPDGTRLFSEVQP